MACSSYQTISTAAFNHRLDPHYLQGCPVIDAPYEPYMVWLKGVVDAYVACRHTKQVLIDFIQTSEKEH